MEIPRANVVTVDHEMFKGEAWSLPTDINLVNYAEEAFANKLKEAGWEEDSFGLLLAFREALINAISHGNLGIPKKIHGEDLSVTAKREQAVHPTDKKISITFEVSEGKVSVTIEDQGNGFEHQTVADPTQSENLLEARGRGLYLMRNCFDSATFNEKGNKVTMVKEKK